MIFDYNKNNSFLKKHVEIKLQKYVKKGCSSSKDASNIWEEREKKTR